MFVGIIFLLTCVAPIEFTIVSNSSFFHCVHLDALTFIQHCSWFYCWNRLFSLKFASNKFRLFLYTFFRSCFVNFYMFFNEIYKSVWEIRRWISSTDVCNTCLCCCIIHFFHMSSVSCMLFERCWLPWFTCFRAFVCVAYEIIHGFMLWPLLRLASSWMNIITFTAYMNAPGITWKSCMQVECLVSNAVFDFIVLLPR